MFKPTAKQLLVLVGSILTILFNLAATTLPLNGKSTAELSDQFKVFFVPAGYVFAIWGVIYVGMLAFSFYQWTNSYTKKPILNRIFGWYMLGLVANCLWLVFWHYQHVGLSVITILVLLGSLIAIYIQVQKQQSKDSSFNNLVKLPFSIYLGWASVATIANITAFLWSWGYTTLLLGGQLWTAILMLIAGGLGVLAIWRHRDYAFPVVIIWAVVGIMVKFPTENLILAGGIACILGIIVAGIYRYQTK